MNEHDGGSFDPETIVLMRAALDEAWASLSASQQAHMSQSVLAERILKVAAKGERDLGRLRASALIGLATHSHAST